MKFGNSEQEFRARLEEVCRDWSARAVKAQLVRLAQFLGWQNENYTWESKFPRRLRIILHWVLW